MSESVQLHLEEFVPLLLDVHEIAPVIADWLEGMGFCPDALARISDDGALQATRSGDDPRDALASMYLGGFVLGVLAERAIDREDRA